MLPDWQLGVMQAIELNIPTMFAIKAEVTNPEASTFVFSGQKTMYGGKQIAEGDPIFIFASENEGGCGLIALGTVTSVSATPRKPGVARSLCWCIAIWPGNRSREDWAIWFSTSSTTKRITGGRPARCCIRRA